MSKEQRKITGLLTEVGQHYVLGQEGPTGCVETISFRRDIHKTTGHSGMPCYVIRYVNSTVQTVVPHHAVAEYTTDINRQVDEDIGNVPELPEQIEEE